jgi:hypothetical protein
MCSEFSVGLVLAAFAPAARSFVLRAEQDAAGDFTIGDSHGSHLRVVTSGGWIFPRKFLPLMEINPAGLCDLQDYCNTIGEIVKWGCLSPSYPRCHISGIFSLRRH